MAQQHPHVRIESSDFHADDVHVLTLSGREAISELFDFTLHVVCSDDAEVDAIALSGATATLVFEAGDAEVRRIHGVFCEVDDLLDTEGAHRAYRLRFVPRAFRLRLVETFDIFVDKSVPEIIRTKLGLAQLDDTLDLRINEDYPKREFVAQYAESDLAFVSRLAEHLGVSFFFEPHGDDERMVFTDHPGGFTLIADDEVVPFRARGEARDVFRLESKRRLVPLLHAVRDYNYRSPQIDLTHTVEAPSGHGGGVVEYGAHVKTPAEAKQLADARAEAAEASALVYTGKSDRPALRAGGRFVVGDHPRLGDVRLLVTEVVHECSQRALGAGSDEQGYVNTFRAIPAERTYRPARVTPVPRIHGLLTGVVEHHLGASVESSRASLDDEGRYLVRFLFDTAPPADRRASRPIRMAQNHAGAHYGTHFPLRPGAEVLIAFVNGDPDRPVIVGAVPNPLTPSPVAAKNGSMSRIVTATGAAIEFGER